ncbi:MAG: galactosyltransferase-related protein, partial [Gammaproteobacteria bacterium]
LIFIDGDCLPHRCFVQRHLACAEPGSVCAGRRVELGPWFSTLLRRHAWARWLIQRQWFYPLLAVPMTLDRVKNYEAGLSSSLLNRANRNKPARILGSNFSCHRGDLLKINGFNEDFVRPGIGEDSDVDWRLRASGIRFKNLKFIAIQYHLYHGGQYVQSEENLGLMHQAQARNEIYCPRGIDQYLECTANR